jgi:hypothetical protein
MRLWGKTAGRPDKRCADPADTLVGIGVLEEPLLIKSLMSQTQSERIGNDQHSKLIQRNLKGDLRAHSAQCAGGCRDHRRDFPRYRAHRHHHQKYLPRLHRQGNASSSY